MNQFPKISHVGDYETGFVVHTRFIDLEDQYFCFISPISSVCQDHPMAQFIPHAFQQCCKALALCFPRAWELWDVKTLQQCSKRNPLVTQMCENIPPTAIVGVSWPSSLGHLELMMLCMLHKSVQDFWMQECLETPVYFWFPEYIQPQPVSKEQDVLPPLKTSSSSPLLPPYPSPLLSTSVSGNTRLMQLAMQCPLTSSISKDVREMAKNALHEWVQLEHCFSSHKHKFVYVNNLKIATIKWPVKYRTDQKMHENLYVKVVKIVSNIFPTPSNPGLKWFNMNYLHLLATKHSDDVMAYQFLKSGYWITEKAFVQMYRDRLQIQNMNPDKQMNEELFHVLYEALFVSPEKYDKPPAKSSKKRATGAMSKTKSKSKGKNGKSQTKKAKHRQRQLQLLPPPQV